MNVQNWSKETINKWLRLLTKELVNREERERQENKERIRSNPKVAAEFLMNMSGQSENSFDGSDQELIRIAFQTVGRVLGRRQRSNAQEHFGEAVYLCSRDGRENYPGRDGDERFEDARQKLQAILTRMV